MTVLFARIGRTGRAGKHGTSISLWERRDWRKAGGLVTIMEEAGQVRIDWTPPGPWSPRNFVKYKIPL